MSNFNKRGLLASVGALVTVAALALGGAAAAQASSAKMPDRSGLIITKLEQPESSGAAATGLPQESDLPPIAGVTFEAMRVPLLGDPMTNEGRTEIANTTLADAQNLVGDAPADRTGVTDAAGEIHWQTSAAAGKKDGEDLEAGLWLVRETQSPAGVVPAGDFLVGLPLTDPSDRSKWLNTVYVYPKNHTVEGTKEAEDTGDLSVGSTVTWAITIDNPSPRNTGTGEYGPADMFRVIDELTEEYLTTPMDGSGLTVTQPAGLNKGGDYTVNVASTGGKRIVTVDFTAAGLNKIAAVPTQQVVLKLETLIVKGGVIENSARFYTSETQTDAKEIPGKEIKLGDYALTKKSEGAPAGTTPNLAGAEFMVFSNEEDAIAANNGDQAARERAVRPDVSVPGYDKAAGTWTTNSDGRVDVIGLRYSGFAEGESFGEGDPRYITYWLVETLSLEGHQMLSQPISFIIDGDSATQDTQTIVNQYDRGGFVLPLTGGTGTLLLTLAGLALLVTVLAVARKRSNAHAAE